MGDASDKNVYAERVRQYHNSSLPRTKDDGKVEVDYKGIKGIRNI